MTLQNFSKEQLATLKSTTSSIPFKELLESRIEDIREDDFRNKVADVEGMLKREYNRGMAQAYESVLSLPEMVDEEEDLREKEKLAQGKKK
jgi:hypothetical protein